MYKLEIVIHQLPPMINRINTMHWSVKAKMVREWQQMVIIQSTKMKPKEPLDKAYLILTRFSEREPDYDGNVSGFKAAVDGLIRGGIILDDKTKVVFGREYKWEKAKRGEGKVKIEVFDLEAYNERKSAQA